MVSSRMDEKQGGHIKRCVYGALHLKEPHRSTARIKSGNYCFSSIRMAYVDEKKTRKITMSLSHTVCPKRIVLHIGKKKKGTHSAAIKALALVLEKSAYEPKPNLDAKVLLTSNNHQVAQLVRVSLTLPLLSFCLSIYLSLTSITPGRSSRQHPVSEQSFCR